MFKIYDLDMNHIPFPEGVMPLEIFIGSIQRDRIAEGFPGRSGVVDYGATDTSRPVELFLRMKSYDRIDYRLQRNEMYAVFDNMDGFYVVEDELPTRMLKVAMDDSYIPERLTEQYADVTINCRTLDKVYWESRYTTKELNDDGFDATVEKYGLADGIDDTMAQYRFTEDTFEVYNAGNVTIRPEDMYLEITLRGVTTDDVFTVKNLSTDETFEFRKAVSDRNVYIEGMSVYEGSYNGLRDTNRKFVSLQPGVNQFEVTGGTFNEITVDFRYLYK